MLARQLRRTTPSLVRSVSNGSAAGAPAFKAESMEDKPAEKDAPPRKDPWSSIFDNIPTPLRSYNRLNRPHNTRLPPGYFSSYNSSGSRRGYATRASSDDDSRPSPSHSSRSTGRDQLWSDPENSFLSSPDNPWDHVFSNINAMPPLAPQNLRNVVRSSTSSGHPSHKRQTMNRHEAAVFDQMFDLIFDSVDQQQRGLSEEEGREEGHDKVSAGIGKPRSGLNDLVDKMRNQAKRTLWTDDDGVELDKKKQEMDLCDTDYQLLEWAMQNVFGESQRYEEAARQSSTNPSSSNQLPLQPSTYPHLLAALIRDFRDKYHDPHLALSIFDHARQLSIASYVFGCTAPAYNELVLTRWRAFRDLKGVRDALEEMNVNGVECNSGTRRIVERIRREVAEGGLLWEEEDGVALAEGEGEGARVCLNRIEELVVEKKRPLRTSGKRPMWKGNKRGWDEWKRAEGDDRHVYT